jgi:hypothetical protein
MEIDVAQFFGEEKRAGVVDNDPAFLPFGDVQVHEHGLVVQKLRNAGQQQEFVEFLGIEMLFVIEFCADKFVKPHFAFRFYEGDDFIAVELLGIRADPQVKSRRAFIRFIIAFPRVYDQNLVELLKGYFNGRLAVIGNILNLRLEFIVDRQVLDFFVVGYSKKDSPAGCVCEGDKLSIDVVQGFLELDPMPFAFLKD